jgi:hypothetical protein
MTQRSDTYKYLQSELCRAEQVVHEADNSNIKRHEPTIDMHRGMIVSYRKAIAFLDNEEIAPSEPFRIERNCNVIFCEKLLLAILLCAIILTL